MRWRRNSGLFSLAGLAAMGGLLAVGCEPPVNNDMQTDTPAENAMEENAEEGTVDDLDETVEPGGLSGDNTATSAQDSP